jgi:hypothetical protein
MRHRNIAIALFDPNLMLMLTQEALNRLGFVRFIIV